MTQIQRFDQYIDSIYFSVDEDTEEKILDIMTLFDRFIYDMKTIHKRIIKNNSKNICDLVYLEAFNLYNSNINLRENIPINVLLKEMDFVLNTTDKVIKPLRTGYIPYYRENIIYNASTDSIEIDKFPTRIIIHQKDSGYEKISVRKALISHTHHEGFRIKLSFNGIKKKK